MTDEKKFFMVLKMEYCRFLKIDDMKTDNADSQIDILDTTEQRRFNDFLSQIKEEQKNINMKSFKEYFSYGKPDIMVQDLFDSKSKLDNYDKPVPIYESFDNIVDKANKLPPSTNKHEFVKMLKIVDKILDFNEQIQKGQGLKILTPSQMLSRLPISLAQLKAGNNSEKLKNEIRQLLHSLYR